MKPLVIIRHRHYGLILARLIYADKETIAIRNALKINQNKIQSIPDFKFFSANILIPVSSIEAYSTSPELSTSLLAEYEKIEREKFGQEQAVDVPPILDIIVKKIKEKKGYADTVDNKWIELLKVLNLNIAAETLSTHVGKDILLSLAIALTPEDIRLLQTYVSTLS